jgi:hypothetical protein
VDCRFCAPETRFLACNDIILLPATCQTVRDDRYRDGLGSGVTMYGVIWESGKSTRPRGKGYTKQPRERLPTTHARQPLELTNTGNKLIINVSQTSTWNGCTQSVKASPIQSTAARAARPKRAAAHCAGAISRINGNRLHRTGIKRMARTRWPTCRLMRMFPFGCAHSLWVCHVLFKPLVPLSRRFPPNKIGRKLVDDRKGPG